MQTRPDWPPPGALLRIRNRKTQRFLSAKLREVDSTGVVDPEQCWILQEVADNRYEIVEMRTGEVLAWPPGRTSLRLERSRGSLSTLWSIEHAESVEGAAYFWIKPFR